MYSMSGIVAYFVVAGQSLADAWILYPAVRDAFRSEFLRFNPQYTDVQFFDAATGGTTMLRASADHLADISGEPERAARYWYDETRQSDGPIFDIYEQRLADWAVGKDVLGIIWDQGQSDTPYVQDARTAALYAEGLEYILTRLMALSGAPDVYFQGFGDRSDYEERLNGGSDIIRQIQQDFGDSHPWAQLLTTTFDLPLTDSVHLTEAGYVVAATRMALAISTGIASPLLGFATLASDGRIFVSIDLAASQGIDALTTADAFRLFDAAGNPVRIDEVDVDSAAGLVIVTPAALLQTALLQYASATYSFGLNADDLLYSGDLPVQPFNISLARSSIGIVEHSAGQYRFTGSGQSDHIVGFRSDDILMGGGGNDVLDGAGGADRLYGGDGNDSYYVDHTSDRAYEVSATGGIDTVFSSVTHSLGANVERLTLTGDVAVRGYGNDLANLIIGNSGNNQIDGRGGADSMRGRLGNDIYHVDNSGDRVVEEASAGFDLVYSTVTHTLGANVEQLSLRGDAAIRGYGNDLNNLIYGNAANNVIDGRGGDDSMRGGAGNDTYYVDSTRDRVLEAAGAGTDFVYSTVSHTLGANVERLVLTGSAASNGIGNGLANVMTGNGAANRLFGLAGADTLIAGAGNDQLNGGTGNDRLTGGAGLDKFIFDTALAANFDAIMDFSVADDVILLDQTVFSGIAGLGTLSAGAFALGRTAQDANDRVLYDATNGRIYYDADGNGAGAAVLFASVTAGTALTASDFYVVA
ncbi:MAG: hypothetical protein M3Q52_09310 [Pseudomonadota bacterium]|nr:hypothetical protein [Pseudomonadota bacterium]